MSSLQRVMESKGERKEMKSEDAAAWRSKDEDRDGRERSRLMREGRERKKKSAAKRCEREKKIFSFLPVGPLQPRRPREGRTAWRDGHP